MCAGVSLNIHSFIGLFFFLHNWCNTGPSMCDPFCGMVHIKEPLLLIRKNSPCGGSGFPLSLSEWFFRCHYTKSNPIDNHSNISSKRLQKQNFKPLGHYTRMQCGTSHLQTVQENILSHIILATYRKFTAATVRFTQNVNCNIYTHPIYQVANVTV